MAVAGDNGKSEKKGKEKEGEEQRDKTSAICREEIAKAGINDGPEFRRLDHVWLSRGRAKPVIISQSSDVVIH